MAPVQISGHAGTFPNSILILSEKLSRKIIACERMNIDKKRIRKYLAIWLDGINAHKLIRKIHSVLFAFNDFIMFLPHFLYFFLLFYVITFGLICVLNTFAFIGCHLPLVSFYSCTRAPHPSFSLPLFFFLSLSFSTSTFLYFWLSWRRFSVLWPLGFKWSPSAACLSS